MIFFTFLEDIQPYLFVFIGVHYLFDVRQPGDLFTCFMVALF